MNLQSLISRYQGLGEQWRAHLLSAILKLAIPITFVLTLVSLFDARGLSVDVVASSLALVFEIFVWRIWAKGRLDRAASILVVGSTIITSLYILFSGGVMSPLLGGQIFLAAMAALLTSTRFTLATVTVLIIFNVFTLNSQQLPPAILSETPLLRLSAQIAYLVITAGTILYSIRILKLITLNLANSEHRFRALFEKTSDAVFISGLDLHLIEVNDQAAKMLNYTPEEMSGLPVKNLFPADEWAEVQKRFDEVKGSKFLVPTTRRFISKTGVELMLETNLSLVHDAKGNPLHYQSTGRDVTQKVMEEQRMKSTLVHMVMKASTDALTGILNRETVLQHAEAEWQRYQREQLPMSVMMMDMDRLKQINDTCGHPAGDQALSSVARVIERQKRAYDWAGRYGGDEFLVVLPGTAAAAAQAVGQRMQDAIRNEQIKVGKDEQRLSCCFGVASTEGHEPPIGSVTELVEIADAALYRAKRQVAS